MAISSAILQRIMDEAGGPREACGLLLGDGGAGNGEAIATAPATANVSPTPATAFEIDPAALLAACRRQRQAGGPAVLGYWHTHPSGDDAPSVTDAACAAPDDRLWLIATGERARLWRAVRGGTVHGRFVPVRLDLVTGGRVEKNVRGVQRRAGGGLVALADPESQP